MVFCFHLLWCHTTTPNTLPNKSSQPQPKQKKKKLIRPKHEASQSKDHVPRALARDQPQAASRTSSLPHVSKHACSLTPCLTNARVSKPLHTLIPLLKRYSAPPPITCSVPHTFRAPAFTPTHFFAASRRSHSDCCVWLGTMVSGYMAACRRPLKDSYALAGSGFWCTQLPYASFDHCLVSGDSCTRRGWAGGSFAPSFTLLKPQEWGVHRHRKIVAQICTRLLFQRPSSWVCWNGGRV